MNTHIPQEGYFPTLGVIVALAIINVHGAARIALLFLEVVLSDVRLVTVGLLFRRYSEADTLTLNKKLMRGDMHTILHAECSQVL